MAPLKVPPPCGKGNLGSKPPGGGGGGNLHSGLFLKLKNLPSRIICAFVERSTSNSTKHRGIKYMSLMMSDKKNKSVYLLKS